MSPEEDGIWMFVQNVDDLLSIGYCSSRYVVEREVRRDQDGDIIRSAVKVCLKGIYVSLRIFADGVVAPACSSHAVNDVVRRNACFADPYESRHAGELFIQRYLLTADIVLVVSAGVDTLAFAYYGVGGVYYLKELRNIA